jgi:opacity protein-like surface antigen
VVLSDAIYMDLRGNGERSVPGIQTRSQADLTQLALELDGGYFITERIALYAGARYNDIDADLRVDVTTLLGTNRRSASGSASWVDPIVGLLGHFPLAPRWSVDLKADIGGFGVGSEFTWQVMGGVRWQLNDAWDLTAAYRYLDVDYEDLNGTGIVRYNVVSQGPMLGGTWHF